MSGELANGMRAVVQIKPDDDGYEVLVRVGGEVIRAGERATWDEASALYTQALLEYGLEHYTAYVSREDRWLIISVPMLHEGSVTQARRLRDVPAMTIDLIETMTGVTPGEVLYRVSADALAGDRRRGFLRLPRRSR